MKFAEMMGEWMKDRMAFQRTAGELYGWTERDYALFNQGLSMGVNLMLSATDSRSDDGKGYRIVDEEGDVIPFYAAPVEGEVVDMINSPPGIIVQIWNIAGINT
jgi:hypothetical protein